MEKIRLSQDRWEYLLNLKDKNIFGSQTDDAAFVENIHFTEDFFYSDSFSVSFKDCLFEGKATFHGSSLKSPIFYTNCLFKKDLYLGELKSKDKISFLDCTMEETATFVQSDVFRLELNLKYAKKIILDSRSAIQHVQIGGKDRNKFGTIHINIPTELQRFEINHAEIADFYLGYSTLDAELIVANSILQKITIDNFRNAGSFKFLNCKSSESNSTSIVINQTNLGNAGFFGFAFSTFAEINITNSVLYECVFINCFWAKKNMMSKVVHFSAALDLPEEKTNRRVAENLRDVFKQIKTAYSRQADYVLEQYFHGLEMNAYYKSLSFRTEFWTKVILRLSFWTSNYGQSFIRPLLLIISVNALLFLGMFYMHATEYNSGDLGHISNYVNTAASLLNFMNPLHKIRDTISGLPFILDTISRIVSSYLIYNMIRATRRFVK